MRLWHQDLIPKLPRPQHIRDLLDATVKLRDGKKVTDMEMNVVQKLALKEALKKLEGTEIEKLLKEYNVI